MLLFLLFSSLASIIFELGVILLLKLFENMEVDDDDGELNLEGDMANEVVVLCNTEEGIADMVVMLVEVKGLRRLADLGKSKIPPLLLF